MTLGDLSFYVAMAGTVAFAVSAVLAVAERRVDLFAAIVLGTLATAVYVFRIVEQLFFQAVPGEPAVATGPKFDIMSAASVSLTACIIVLGLITETIVSGVILPILPKGLTLVG